MTATMPEPKKKFRPCDYHRFIDEAGDITFFGKGGLWVLGQEGVAKTFILGMSAYNEPLVEARAKISEFCRRIADDQYFNTMQGSFAFSVGKINSEYSFEAIFPYRPRPG